MVASISIGLLFPTTLRASFGSDKTSGRGKKNHDENGLFAHQESITPPHERYRIAEQLAPRSTSTRAPSLKSLCFGCYSSGTALDSPHAP